MNDLITQRALAPWFGAKRTMADRAHDPVGPHHTYWGPFCGSMAVVFAKPLARMETVNDLHGDLVNLARVVKDQGLSGRLYWRLRRTLPAAGLFRESLSVVRNEPAYCGGPNVERAYHYFIVSWLGMNGVAGRPHHSTGFARRFSSKGGAPGPRFVGAVESLPWWHERLRAVLVLSSCGIELCERIEDRAGTAVYVDPPYLVKGARYVHDFDGADHDRPRLSGLYPGWTLIEATQAKSLVNAGRRTEGRTDAPEVPLVNGPVTPAEELSDAA